MIKIKVEWLTKSPSMFKYYKGKRDFHLKGGRLYEMEILSALQNHYEVSINPNFIKKETTLNYVFKSHKKHIKGDVCILDPYVIAFGKFNKQKKNIAIVHHIDEAKASSFFGKIFINQTLRNLKKVDKVVVVSKYWEDYLLKRKIKNIEVVYNSFDVKNYDFNKEEINNFKERKNLPFNKPIIYLGQNSSGKGVERIMDYINFNKYHLIVTGKNKYPSKYVNTMYFENNEFPLFLACCDVVLTMSTMTEGWNRTAHEAILAGTPVIGSGSGGMSELLEMTNQTILYDLNSLDSELEKNLHKDKKELIESKNHLSKFNKEYFSSTWKRIIAEI